MIKSLNKTYINAKKKPHLIDMNPKAVTADELFGYINPATREWKDGKHAFWIFVCVFYFCHTCDFLANNELFFQQIFRLF